MAKAEQQLRNQLYRTHTHTRARAHQKPPKWAVRPRTDSKRVRRGVDGGLGGSCGCCQAGAYEVLLPTEQQKQPNEEEEVGCEAEMPATPSCLWLGFRGQRLLRAGSQFAGTPARSQQPAHCARIRTLAERHAPGWQAHVTYGHVAGTRATYLFAFFQGTFTAQRPATKPVLKLPSSTR